MSTKTQLSLKNMGKPHGKPQTPSGGTGGYANSRSIDTAHLDQTKRKPVTGPTSYTNFVIPKGKR